MYKLKLPFSIAILTLSSIIASGWNFGQKQDKVQGLPIKEEKDKRDVYRTCNSLISTFATLSILLAICYYGLSVAVVKTIIYILIATTVLYALVGILRLIG